MNLFLNVYNFWKENKEYWISIKNKGEADEKIYKLFWKEDLSREEVKNKEEIIGKVIYYDQFYRHFYRYLKAEKEDEIKRKREEVKILLDSRDSLFWNDLEDWELVFCLMVYKHLSFFEKCFKECFKWCSNKNILIKGNILISKFFNDTYNKAYSYENICPILQRRKDFIYSPREICDFYPEKKINIEKKKFFGELRLDLILPKDQIIIISLSGGVDSMVILYYIKKILGWNNIVAVNIIYNNRKESREEFEFISEYCDSLDVPLYYYSIPFLKRGEIEREFYEKITREIRFNVYKKVNEMLNLTLKYPNVILGHIQDDVVENIWTNIGKCQHLSNLKKMEDKEMQMGVWICRPFLKINKKEIYDFSIHFGIPYLKNTTPEWSNRGKFRNNFYPSLVAQYGEEIDKKIIEFSEMIQEKDRIIEKMIYNPILNSFDKENKRIDITKALEAKLGIDGWIYLLEQFSHRLFNVIKPSIHSVQNFVTRLYKWNQTEKIIIQMSKEYQFRLIKINKQLYLELQK